MQLYSDHYKELLKELHARQDRPRGFGGKVKPLGLFDTFMNKWRPNTALDYGCGKGVILLDNQTTYPDTTWYGYDPAVPQFEKIRIDKCDLVFCNDVLEHIEPDYITNVLQHINKLSTKYIWLRIDTKPARKIMKDGRNAHLIQQDEDWWSEMLQHNVDGFIKYTALHKKAKLNGKLDIAIEK
jgi:hypothetical protein